MPNVLTPGYLKWDGSKYILDPGTSGSITGDAGGDLSGTYPDPVVSKVNGTTITDTPTANQVLTSLNGSSAAWSEITDAHVGNAAAIAGTKISPNFGSQNIATTGSIAVGAGAPTISSGSGAPATTPPEGSIYLRTNGDADTAIYVYQDAAWTPINSSGGGGFTAGGDLTGSSSSQTIDKIQSVTLDTSGKTTGAFLRYSGTQWVAVNTDTIDMEGDVGGKVNASQVNKIRGIDVDGTAPTTNQVLAYVSSKWTPTTLATTADATTGSKGIIQLAGDIGGAATSVSVTKANGATIPLAGALTTGNTLQVSGASALSYGPLNLAGGVNYVTGTLPNTNLPDATTGAKGIVQLAGDLAGTAASVTVAKANGASVPAAGSLTTGNGLYVSGASALSYSALNLAGGANYVTGVLPSANLFQATTGTSGAVRLTGDLGGTAASPTVVDLTITSEANGSMLYFNGSNWVNRSAGTANYILTANGAGAPTWNNSIQAMTNVQSQQFRLDPASGTAGYTQTFFDTLSTTSNTITTARTIAVPAGYALVVTATATAVDGYTGYSGTQRTFCQTKAARYYRASAGSLKLSDFTSVQDLTPNFGTADDLLLTLSISSNDLLIRVTGQSGLNAKWQVDTTVRWVAI